MSHVATVECEIKDLASLKAACAELGLEFRENQKTYKWFGQHVGDYPLPEGFTVNMLGTCEHAIGIKGDNHAYELGVYRKPDGSYGLIYDFYCRGYGLEEKIGKRADKLTQEYTAQRYIRNLPKGYVVKRRWLDEKSGNVKIEAVKKASW